MLFAVRSMLVVPVFVLVLDGLGSAQTNLFVDSNPAVGNDNNSGCLKTAPKRNLTSPPPNPPGVLEAIDAQSCGPPPYVVWMRAGSAFPGGFSLRPETRLAYWNNGPLAGQAVTFTSGNILISTATGGMSLTATTGLDGAGGAAGSQNIVVQLAGATEGVRIESTGTFTNSSIVRNVRVEHAAAGAPGTSLRLQNQGGVLSAAITDCTFFTPAPGVTTPPTGSNAGSEHVYMDNGNPGTTVPSLTGCLFQVAPGAALLRAIYANPFGGGTMSPSISSCTVTGNGADPDVGLFFQKGLGFGVPTTISPSIATSTVTDCGDSGIFFDVSGANVTGSPTITGTTVSGCGLTLPTINPATPWQGNGVAIVVGNGAFLAPSILSTRIENHNYHCLGLFTQVNAGSATIGGSVRDCTIRESGAITATGDGVRLRTNIQAASGANSAIGTSFDDNNISLNRSDGVAIFTEGSGDAINYSSVTSVFTNNVIHHNDDNAVDLFAMVVSAIMPTFTYNTMADNGGVGWREGPILVTGLAGQNPLVYNSILRFNSGSSPGGPDSTTIGVPAGGANFFYSNFAEFALFPGNVNNGVAVALSFVNAAAGNYHLNMALPPNPTEIIDYALEAVPAAPTSDFDGQGRVFDFMTPNTLEDGDRGADERYP